MAKKSMHKAKRCAKGAQKTTALEAFLQTFTKAKEEAIAPQRKKARVTKQEQPQTADAEAAAESETEQEEMDQMRDTDEGGARHQPTKEQRETYPPGYENWSSSKRSNWRRRRKDK